MEIRLICNLSLELWLTETYMVSRSYVLDYNPGNKLMAKRQNCAKVEFPRYTESVKFKSQSRDTASKRKPYR